MVQDLDASTRLQAVDVCVGGSQLSLQLHQRLGSCLSGHREPQARSSRMRSRLQGCSAGPKSVPVQGSTTHSHLRTEYEFDQVLGVIVPLAVHPFGFHSLHNTLQEHICMTQQTSARLSQCMYEPRACICVRIQGALQLCQPVTAHSHQVRRRASRCNSPQLPHLRSKGLHTTAMSAKPAKKNGASTAERLAAVPPPMQEQPVRASEEGQHQPVSAASKPASKKHALRVS